MAHLRGGSQECPGRVWKGREERNVGIKRKGTHVRLGVMTDDLRDLQSMVQTEIRGRIEMVLFDKN